MIPFAATAAAKTANAFEWLRQPPKIAPFSWDFIALPEQDRTTAIEQHAEKYWYRSRVWLRRHPHGQTDILITILTEVK